MFVNRYAHDALVEDSVILTLPGLSITFPIAVLRNSKRLRISSDSSTTM